MKLSQLGKGQKKSIMCQFFSHTAVAHNATAYTRHTLVICPVQTSKRGLVALSPSFYKLFYVHLKHTVSIGIDTISQKRLHGISIIFYSKYFLYPPEGDIKKTEDSPG